MRFEKTRDTNPGKKKANYAAGIKTPTKTLKLIPKRTFFMQIAEDKFCMFGVNRIGIRRVMPVNDREIRSRPGIKHMPIPITPIGIDTQELEEIEIGDLMGFLINTNLDFDTFRTKETRDKGALNNINLISETPESDIHILIGLRKDVDVFDTVMAMKFEPFNS